MGGIRGALSSGLRELLRYLCWALLVADTGLKVLITPTRFFEGWRLVSRSGEAEKEQIGKRCLKFTVRKAPRIIRLKTLAPKQTHFAHAWLLGSLKCHHHGGEKMVPEFGTLLFCIQHHIYLQYRLWLKEERRKRFLWSVQGLLVHSQPFMQPTGETMCTFTNFGPVRFCSFHHNVPLFRKHLELLAYPCA